jgi:hypothetical protein
MSGEVKTLRDCAACPDVSRCDAHITGGTHRQCAPIDLQEGIMPEKADENAIAIPTPTYFIKIIDPSGDDVIYASELIGRLRENLREEDIKRGNMSLVRWEASNVG